MDNITKRNLGIIILIVNFAILGVFGRIESFSGFLIEGGIVLLIVSIIFMIVPIIVRLISKKRISFKKGTLLCAINCFVIFLAYFIYLLTKYIEIGKSSYYMDIETKALIKQIMLVTFVWTVNYYCVNMLFFVEDRK